MDLFNNRDPVSLIKTIIEMIIITDLNDIESRQECDELLFVLRNTKKQIFLSNFIMHINFLWLMNDYIFDFYSN